MVAIKVEKIDTKKQVLKLEVTVLKKLQQCPYVCRFLTCGRYADWNFMVMELLGDNLSELRRRQYDYQPDGRFSLGTTVKLGVQMMRALEAVHELGYLHRDVKPSNFAIGLAGVKRRTVYLIDFGLARRYLLANGEVRPARESSGFRGTARYASIYSHLQKDLGRRDDLWSLFYVLVEFAQGFLPWRRIKDKDQIGEMKMKINNAELVKDLPREFEQWMNYLQTLQYEDKPDYRYLESLLKQLGTQLSIDDNSLFDWEHKRTASVLPTSGSGSNLVGASQPDLVAKATNPAPAAGAAAKPKDDPKKKKDLGKSTDANKPSGSKAGGSKLQRGTSEVGSDSVPPGSGGAKPGESNKPKGKTKSDSHKGSDNKDSISDDNPGDPDTDNSSSKHAGGSVTKPPPASGSGATIPEPTVATGNAPAPTKPDDKPDIPSKPPKKPASKGCCVVS